MSYIQSIILRPERKAEPFHVEEAQVTASGLEGDHYLKPEGRRQVTIISGSGLAEVAASVGFQGDAHTACRRNICVDALPDGDMTGRHILIGDEVILEVTCYCDPCQRMNENFGDGAVEAFDHKAGWGTRVIREGMIRVGDTIDIR